MLLKDSAPYRQEDATFPKPLLYLLTHNPDTHHHIILPHQGVHIIQYVSAATHGVVAVCGAESWCFHLLPSTIIVPVPQRWSIHLQQCVACGHVGVMWACPYLDACSLPLLVHHMGNIPKPWSYTSMIISGMSCHAYGREKVLCVSMCV